MWLLVVAAFGLIVPNGLFLLWVVQDFTTLQEVLSHKLALALILDAILATALLAWHFAVRPLGHLRWPWFLLLALIGGLGFAIPFYAWLNRRGPKA
jgi:hypothetical protein